jgi:drug/metabolite transporter (DMT)-like permease
MTKRNKALAAIIVCMLFWGFSFISIKIAVAVFPPMTLGALRFAVALVFLFILKKKMAPNEKAAGKDMLLLACVGLTGVTFYFFFENNGVLRIPASEASIIIGAIPVMTMIAEMVKERVFSRQKESGHVLEKIVLPGTGALISLIGVALVAGVSFALSGTGLGYLYMAGACVCWVLYCFLTAPLFSRHSRIFIVFWQSLVGFLGFLPFTFLELSWQMQDMPMPGIEIWGHVLFLGICCSALGYWFYAQSLEVLGIGTTSLFINFIPVISAIGGFMVLGERLQPLQWLGAALVLAGVYLAIAAQRIAIFKSNEQ